MSPLAGRSCDECLRDIAACSCPGDPHHQRRQPAEVQENKLPLRLYVGAILACVLVAMCAGCSPTTACERLHKGFATVDGREAWVSLPRLQDVWVEFPGYPGAKLVECARVQQP